MAETTHISWCDMTWNPVIGCTKVSPACDFCYAENLMANRHKRVVWGKPGQHGTLSRTSAHNWNEPIRWNKKAIANGTRPFVFCSSLSDVFDKNWEPEWRPEAFDVMRKTPALVYLLLTKRPQNIIRMVRGCGGLPPNVALGTTIEDDKRAKINGDHLLRAGAEVNPLFLFYSCEPLLEIIEPPMKGYGQRIAWVITGGESAQGSHKPRPTHSSAFEWLQQDARENDAVFHHKQNGEYLVCGPDDAGGVMVMPFGPDGPAEHRGYPPPMMMKRVGRAAAGRLLNGQVYDARPAVPAL